jgi:hypothetical protein
LLGDILGGVAVLAAQQSLGGQQRQAILLNRSPQLFQ